MFTFSTYVKAICPITEQLFTYETDIKIEAISKQHALDWAQENGYGYLHIGDPISYVYDSETKEREQFDYYLN